MEVFVLGAGGGGGGVGGQQDRCCEEGRRLHQQSSQALGSQGLAQSRKCPLSLPDSVAPSAIPSRVAGGMVK